MNSFDENQYDEYYDDYDNDESFEKFSNRKKPNHGRDKMTKKDIINEKRRMRETERDDLRKNQEDNIFFL